MDRPPLSINRPDRPALKQIPRGLAGKGYCLDLSFERHFCLPKGDFDAVKEIHPT